MPLSTELQGVVSGVRPLACVASSAHSGYAYLRALGGVRTTRRQCTSTLGFARFTRSWAYVCARVRSRACVCTLGSTHEPSPSQSKPERPRCRGGRYSQHLRSGHMSSSQMQWFSEGEARAPAHSDATPPSPTNADRRATSPGYSSTPCIVE